MTILRPQTFEASSFGEAAFGRNQKIASKEAPVFFSSQPIQISTKSLKETGYELVGCCAIM
jgi:hypothetical protein